MNSIKISEYFEIVKPKYVYCKLIPLKSLRNYNSDKIIKAIATLYKTLDKRINYINKKYFFTVPCKVSYFIYLEHGSAEFYFVIPKDYFGLLK